MIKLKPLLKESMWTTRKFGEPLPTLEDYMGESYDEEEIGDGHEKVSEADDDDKYVSIGWGKYKEKGKEDDKDAPTFKKTDSGKYVKGKDDEKGEFTPDKEEKPEKEPAGKLGGGDFERDFPKDPDDIDDLPDDDDYDMGVEPGSRDTGPWTPEDDPDFEKGSSLTGAPGRVPDEEPDEVQNLIDNPEEIMDNPDYVTVTLDTFEEEGMDVDDIKAKVEQMKSLEGEEREEAAFELSDDLKSLKNAYDDLSDTTGGDPDDSWDDEEGRAKPSGGDFTKSADYDMWSDDEPKEKRPGGEQAEKDYQKADQMIKKYAGVDIEKAEFWAKKKKQASDAMMGEITINGKKYKPITESIRPTIYDPHNEIKRMLDKISTRQFDRKWKKEII